MKIFIKRNMNFLRSVFYTAAILCIACSNTVCAEEISCRHASDFTKYIENLDKNKNEDYVNELFTYAASQQKGG